MASDPRLQALPIDAVERVTALDPTRSFIVQAPAGSGKTELLMQRYLTLLAHESVTQPETVLAITFTKKAAAEMRNRVFEALQNTAAPEPQEPHKRASWELARRVGQRDQQLGWNILGNPQRLEIRTVDSFCEKIANRTPLLAGLGQTGNIAADFEPLYAEAAQRTLLLLADTNAESASAVARVLRDQDNNFGRVQNLLVEMLGRRDQWLRLIGGSVQWTTEQKAEIRSQLERSLQDAICAELRSIREQIEREVPANIVSALLQFARFGSPNHADLASLADLRALPSAELDALPQWKALKQFCLTKGDDLRKTIGRDCGFLSGGIHREEKQACQDLFEEIANSSYADALCAALVRIAKLPPSRYRDEQWESLLALFRVLLLTVANLRAVFAERGEVDYTEVSLAAKAALGDDGHPTDLALHLGYKIQHLLVDEFQDTSLSQTELLERLIQAWSPESGSTLFVVGDPMQSIYGFRQAEVTLFQRAREKGFATGEWPLEPVNLRANFRSRPELVAWYNRVFPDVLTGNSEVTGAVGYVDCKGARESSAHSRVQCESAPAKDFASEAARVVEIVKKELETDERTIAILVRSRSHVSQIAPALTEARIPFRATKIDYLADRQTVRDLHALTKAMLHLADRTAWLAILRAPWCGLTLADLWELCRAEKKATIWELLNTRRQNLSNAGQKILDRISPILSRAIVNRGRIPLRQLISSLWTSIGGPAALSGDDRAAKLRDAESYLAVLQRVETCGEIDERQLEAEIAQLYAEPDTSPNIRVEIMTIHGAKGLEFDTVILPGLNRRTETNKGQLLNWRERVIEDRRDLLLAPMDPVGTRESETPIAKYITTLGNECSAEETKRLLYVAATRARERLYLVTTMPEHDKPAMKGSMLSLLPPAVLAQFPEQAEVTPTDDNLPRRPNLTRRLPTDWTLPDCPAPLRVESRYPAAGDLEPRKHTFIRVGEDLRRIGTVTHRFLQQMGDEGIEAWSSERIQKFAPAIRALLVQQGIRPAELASAERRVGEALRNTLADENGRWILRKRSDAKNEFALSAVLDGTRHSIKVDRTFVDGDTRWLVDYKTSDREGTITESYLREQIDKYRDDLQRYARILHAFDGRPVKGGLYFPLLQRWCKVDFPS